MAYVVQPEPCATILEPIFVFYIMSIYSIGIASVDFLSSFITRQYTTVIQKKKKKKKKVD